MSEDHRQKHPLEATGEATAGESLSQPRSGFRQTLWKIKKNATKKVSIHMMRSRYQTPAVQNADSEGASSNQNIEDVSRLHDSGGNQPSGEPASKVLDAPPGVEEIPGFQLVNAELRGTESMRLLGGHGISVISAAKDSPKDLAAADDFHTTDLQSLKNSHIVIEQLVAVHPYAKVVLGVLSAASKIILAQIERDQSVQPLLNKVEEIYRFMLQDDTLNMISSNRNIAGRIAQQTLECAHFITNYSETKNFWKRVGKNVFSETDDVIKQYIDALDGLMQQFRDQAIRDAAELLRCTSDKLNLSGMPYAAGAGLNTTKQCLPGTRTDILSQITEWINDSGNTTQCVLWLSGPAGTGKSAIAHTIANRFNEMGRLGSCFCFDRDLKTDKRHEKVFSTITRDLADRDPELTRALADVVQHDNALKHTTDIIQQWHKLLMDPLRKLSGSTVGPVLIVIEALDESGGTNTRRDLLRIIAGKLPSHGPRITELPLHFRILVTSRPLPDIKHEFDGVRHILQLSMDDIPPDVAERDIRTYVSEELKGLPDLHEEQIAMLAAQADGLFEWARCACEYIEAAPSDTYLISRFNAVMSRARGEQANLLYDMYRTILAGMMLTQDEKAMFRLLMAQILGATEPLSLISLIAMRDRLPNQNEHYKADIVRRMGSLLSGTTNSSTPIKPLHRSFREFLTDKASSGDFFIDMSTAQRDLTFASLRVMEDGLRFNLCDLKSSYILNREDPGLQERVIRSIPPHLSYSCRFWSSHLRATVFDTELANEVKSFFEHERLLFWLEVLGITQAISSAVAALPHIVQWLKGHSGYEDVSATAIDVERFVQTFGGIILHSTPHLYVSALSFSPETAISKFAAKFPRTLRLVSGRDLNWPALQSLFGGYADKVLSVSFSPDGTRIATGSVDKTVRLWDAVTGQPVGEPLQGHTGAVNSVSFSPDGTRIVSGSYDKTLRLWVAWGLPLGEPFRGHTARVNSVSFSPDGTHIVSGSSDNTVRLWDTATRVPLGEPFRGHTAWVNSASFSPDGTRIVSSSDDQTVRLWDAATGQPVGEPLRGHTGAVNSVSFSPDGTRIASGSYDWTIRLWDAASGLPLGEPFRGHTAWVNSVSFSPDGTHIVSGSSDNTVRLWEVATGKPIGEPFRGHTAWVNSVSFSPDGTRIVSSSVDDAIRLWYAAAILQPLQECPKQDYSTSSSDRGRTMNTGNNHTIYFSLDPSLRNPAELMEGVSYHNDISTSFSLGADGWMVGPNHRLLFWVPPTSRHLFYSPRTMDGRLTGVDLSRMEHGQSWQKCRDELCDG